MEQFGSQFWMRLKDNKCQPHLCFKMRYETTQGGIVKEGVKTGLAILSLLPTSALKEVGKAKRGPEMGRRVLGRAVGLLRVPTTCREGRGDFPALKPRERGLSKTTW